jgi:tetratricopeptide (TPR) repeat protein
MIARKPAFWLMLLCTVVFARGLGGDFVMDDWPVIKENSKITAFHHVPGYFTSGVWDNTDLAEEVNVTDTALYRPLFLITLNMGYQLWGADPVAFHALNLVLHCVNTLLVFYLILGFVGRPNSTAAIFGAALFAVHPVHVESIAWVAGITDPLVSLFLLSSMLLYRRFLDSGRAAHSALSLLCFAAALLSKEVAIFFPFLLIVYDWLQRRFSLTRYVPYLVLLAVYFLARSAALGQGVEWASFSLSRLPVLGEYLLHYIQLLIIPWPLEYYYERPTISLIATIAGGVIMLTAIYFLPNALRKRHFLPVFALAWFALTLLPALPIALLEKQIFAIRVLYLPSVGLALLAAAFYPAFTQRDATRSIAWGTIVVLSLVSILEIADWKDDVMFFTRATESSPQSFGAYNGLGEAYERNGEAERAANLYLQAAELAVQQSARLLGLDNAARVLGQSGKYDESERYYREILEQDAGQSSAWVGLGNIAMARNDTGRALEFYKKAYLADSNNYVASHNLAIVYRKLGNFDKARQFELISRKIGPSN